MATSVTINGMKKYPGPANDTVIVVDVTVAGSHHQVPFLLSDMKAQGSVANIQKYVAQQCVAANTAAAGVTGTPSADIDIRGTISV